MALVLGFLYMELSFLWFQVKAPHFQELQNLVDMKAVLLEGIGVDPDIIDESRAADVQILPKDVVNELLEGGQGVWEFKRHYHLFKVAKAGTKTAFPFLSFCHSNQVVGPPKVGLDEPFGF